MERRSGTEHRRHGWLLGRRLGFLTALPLLALLLAAGMIARAERAERVLLVGASLFLSLALVLTQSRAGVTGAAESR